MLQVTGYGMCWLSLPSPDLNSVWAGGHWKRVSVLYALRCWDRLAVSVQVSQNCCPPQNLALQQAAVASIAENTQSKRLREEIKNGINPEHYISEEREAGKRRKLPLPKLYTFCEKYETFNLQDYKAVLFMPTEKLENRKCLFTLWWNENK